METAESPARLAAKRIWRGLGPGRTFTVALNAQGVSGVDPLLDAIDDLVQAQVRGDIENFGESGTSNPTQPLGIIRTYH
jgi:hypothetical protein